MTKTKINWTPIIVVGLLAGGTFAIIKTSEHWQTGRDEEARKWLEEYQVELSGIGTEEASLSGNVTEKDTISGIDNVSISANGKTTKSDTLGKYTIDGLDVRKYSVTFSKSGYLEITKEIFLGKGANWLSVSLTPSTEPPPPEPKIPWKWIGIGTAAVLVTILAIKSIPKGK